MVSIKYFLPSMSRPNDMKGVGSIPLPFNEALHQRSASKLLQKKTNDRLEAHLPDVGPGFRDKEVVPLHHLVGAPLTSIRG